MCSSRDRPKTETIARMIWRLRSTSKVTYVLALEHYKSYLLRVLFFPSITILDSPFPRTLCNPMMAGRPRVLAKQKMPRLSLCVRSNMPLTVLCLSECNEN